MDTLVDDIGSFPLPAGIKRETYSKAYELAREAIIRRQRPNQRRLSERKFLQSCSLILLRKNLLQA